MERIIRIIGLFILALFVYFFFSIIFSTCDKQKETLKNQAEAGIEQLGTSISDVASNANDEFFSDETSTEDLDYNSNETVSADDLFEEADIDLTESTPLKETQTQTYSAPVRKPKQTYKSTDGKYLVVAGNFLVEDNALRMKNKLMNLGYNSSETVVFDQSQYHTVLAARYTKYNDAVSMSNRLKNEGVDNYVHTQQY